jgi:hypothetical protein
MLPTPYAGKAVPSIAKKKRASVTHVEPPLDGLSQATMFSPSSDATMFTPGTVKTATILTNFTVEDDSIKCRAGFRKIATRGSSPVWHLIPWHGEPSAMAAASNHELWNAHDGTLLKGGFQSDDWDWTSFSNLSSKEYTIMVNGIDGVWSWDGALVSTDPALVTVTNLSKSSAAGVDAQCTVAAGDIGKFHNGDVVVISGAAGSGLINANGTHVIYNVGVPANTFTLLDVDTSSASGPQTDGLVKVDPPSTGVVKETVTAPVWAPHIQPNQFNIVLSHMNRLWFADSTNLAVYYLPIQQKSGEVHELPLNAVFRRGGHIRAMYTWTLDGGAGMNDQLVIFSSNGECVIYNGVDPDTATGFELSGIFRFDAPMSKHCVANYGGDLFVLISTGLVPLSTLLKAESEHLGLHVTDKGLTSIFLKNAINFRTAQGWQLFLNPSTGRMFCNVPQGAPNRYIQFVRHMPKDVWTTFEDVPARCWNWIDPFVYFGDDFGNVYQMHPTFYNDDGKAIRCDVQMAWNKFKTPSKKRFLALQTYMTTDGLPKPVIDMKVDYDYSAGYNVPDFTETVLGAEWDVGIWDVDYWAQGNRPVTVWNGVAAMGQVGAIRLTAQITNSSFFVNGWDVIFETGALS